MNIYLTTDTHFNHKKMIDDDIRPWDYEIKIRKGLMSLPEDCVLIHLGDVSLGDEEEVSELYIKPLKCKKWLIKGNHDGKSNKWYLEHGWDFVGKQLIDKYFGKKVLFSHKPIEFKEQYDINIHGHFHDSDHRSQEPELLAIANRRQRLLALEYTNYQPVKLEKFCYDL